MTDIVPHLDPVTELDALIHHTVIFPLDDFSWIEVTGEDRVRWLNGMVTNSIQDLAPGQGCFNFLLNAQGRIQGIATAFASPESILLETGSAQADHILALLDRFIIMDDVELAAIPRSGIGLAGPEATTLFSQIGLPIPEGPLTLLQILRHGSPIDLIYAQSPLIPRYELWSTPSTIALLQQALTEAGALPISAETLKALRLLEGTPRFGVDIRDRDLPQETAQTHALHFAKGCYLGQEIVERIRSRGNIHRTLHGFRLEGELPPSGTPLTADGKPVGELTSVAAIPLPTGTLHLALGTIRREAITLPLSYPDGRAYPITLPYFP